jgi:hypothetical protein
VNIHDTNEKWAEPMKKSLKQNGGTWRACSSKFPFLSFFEQWDILFIKNILHKEACMETHTIHQICLYLDIVLFPKISNE